MAQTQTAGMEKPTAEAATTAHDEVGAKERERRAAFAACERFLAGHGRLHPRAALEALAREVRDDEEADRYGTGALIEEFEREVASLLGKETAVFMPSGTMAQQIAMRIWSERKRCSTVAFHPQCHLELHEEKGYQFLHGLHARLVGEPHRLLTLADLTAIKEPYAALLLELPQREIGGQLPSWEDLQAQTAAARERGAAVHMDGARLWESGPYYDRPYAEIAALFDSVYVSFYKGIGGLAGSILAGPADFIAEARVWQRRHGGDLVHLYPYVLGARAGLRDRLDRFPRYHARAKSLAAALRTLPGVAILPDPPHTHMMHIYLPGDAERLMDAAAQLAREERVALFGWLSGTTLPGYARAEVALGDAIEALSDEEIRAYFARVLDEARSGVRRDA
jgi:threonine aldolase